MNEISQEEFNRNLASFDLKNGTPYKFFKKDNGCLGMVVKKNNEEYAILPYIPTERGRYQLGLPYTDASFSSCEDAIKALDEAMAG